MNMLALALLLLAHVLEMSMSDGQARELSRRDGVLSIIIIAA